mmetsp:Transcript_9863/g.32997  ORF Transcript_9863/g.32997 Transcript_9863/m.32997 type:complete len:118 (+) Transcript_9863:524-877(+)
MALEINSRVDIRKKVRWQQVAACELCRPDVAEWIRKEAGEAVILRHLASYAALYTSYSIDLICHALDEVGLRRYLTTRESNESLPISGASAELLVGVEPSRCSANSRRRSTGPRRSC